MRKCPWCASNQMHQFKYVARELPRLSEAHADKPAWMRSICLCEECGEPIIWEETGWRKPTDDEFFTIGTNEKFQSIRSAWVAIKEQARRDELPVMTDWREFYRKTGLGDRPPETQMLLMSVWVKAYQQAWERFDNLMTDDSDDNAYGRWKAIQVELQSMAATIKEQMRGLSEQQETRQ